MAAASRPLENQRWAAVIDTVGSTVLARALSEVDYGGTVACGLAGGADLPTTVMPFILRGVSLLGVDSVMCPSAKRFAWHGLPSADLPGDTLAHIAAHTVALEDSPGCCGYYRR
ncbi:MAG: hypothetical protein R3F37_14030 [Candidatus Competibacteraceae bacterium]